MRNCRLSLFTALLFSVLPSFAQVPNPGSEGRIALKWLENFDDVLAKAKAEKKPVLIDFTADWCGWSKKMDRETFAKREVQKELRDFVLIRINPEANDTNEAVGKKYSIDSFPTLLVVNYQGEETGRREGYMEEVETLKFLREQLPLYKGNPLGYKAVRLEASDPFFAAIKRLPKEGDMPMESAALIVLDYTTVDIQANGRAKYEIRSTYYVIDDEREGLPVPSISYNPSRQKVGFKAVRIMDTNGVGRELDKRLVQDKNLYSDESIYWETKSMYMEVPALKKGQVLDIIEEMEADPLVPGEFYFRWNTGGKVLLDSDFTLTFPSRMAMKKQSIRCPTDVTETKNNDSTTTWRLKTSHTEDDEWEFFSASEDYFEGYEFYTGCQPNTLAKWFNDLCAGRDTLTPEAKTRVADIVKKNPGKRDQLQALLDWVTKDIRYVAVMFKLSTHQPHFAKDTLKNGYGDCKDQVILLQALCKEAGIPSRPVLVGGDLDESILGDHPASEMFGHCILEAAIDGKRLYLDPTAGPCVVGQIPKSYAGQYALRIDPNAGVAVKLPDYEPLSEEFVKREIVLNANGSGTITETRTLLGEKAKEARKDIKADEIEKKRKSMEASYKRSGCKLLEFTLTDPSDKGSNFVSKISFTMPRIASRTAAGLVIHLGEKPGSWLDRLDAPRHKPFQFQSTDWANVEIVATLPGTLKESPGDLEIHNSYMDVSRKISTNNNILRIVEKSRMVRSKAEAKEAGKIIETFRKASDHRYYAFVIELPESDPQASN